MQSFVTFFNNYSASSGFVINLLNESCTCRYSFGVYRTCIKILTFLSFFLLSFQTTVVKDITSLVVVDASFGIHRSIACKWYRESIKKNWKKSSRGNLGLKGLMKPLYCSPAPSHMCNTTLVLSFAFSLASLKSKTWWLHLITAKLLKGFISCSVIIICFLLSPTFIPSQDR